MASYLVNPLTLKTFSVVRVLASGTIGVGTLALVSTTGGPVAVNAPPAASDGGCFAVEIDGSNPLTINGSIDGQSSAVLSNADEVAIFVWDSQGTPEWRRVLVPRKFQDDLPSTYRASDLRGIGGSGGGRIVATGLTQLSASVAIPGTTVFTDAVTLAVPNCAVGDVLMVDVAAIATTGAVGGDFQLLLVDGGVDFLVGQRVTVLASQTRSGVGMSTRWEVLTAGTVTLKLQGAAFSSGVSVLGSGSDANPRSAIRYMQIRS